VPSNRLEDILNSASRVMLEEFRETAVIEHRGGKGSARENILRSFLEKYTPRSVEVVSNGEIVNSSGDVSTQCDILILDGETRPLLTEYGYHVVTAESTRGIIEVKSRLTRDELRSSFGKLLKARLMERYVSVRDLWNTLPDGTRVETWKIPFIYIFAYDSISLDEIFSELIALHEDAPNLARCIDGVWVLSRGFIKWTHLDYLGRNVGDIFPANPGVIPTFDSDSADLVSVRSDESNLLMPFIADLHARLRKPDAPIGSPGVLSRRRPRNRKRQPFS
jgi:hypothetical protein